MKLSRRLFFGRAAGAVAAGPLALEAVAKEVGAMSGFASGGFASVGGPAPGSAGMGTAMACLGNGGGEKAWILARLKEMALGPEKRPVDHVHRLDPDLVANRSMSLGARMRIQADREARRWHEREKDDLLRRLEKLSGL